MEAGSAWPLWIHDHARGDVIVVAQTRGAPALELTESVAHRLAALELSGRHASLAVVAVTDWRSDETTAARWAIGCALLKHLRLAQPGSLVLSHSEQVAADARASLLELAGAMVREVGDRSTTAGVCFNVAGPLELAQAMTAPLSATVVRA